MRTLEYLAKALGLPTGYFLSDAQISDGLVPDGLNEARAAFREQRWADCLALLEADKTAGTTDEGYLLHARAGANAARQALEEGRLAEARELAETAHYYNQEGLYCSPALAAHLAVLLGQILARQGDAYYQTQRDELARTLEELDKLRGEV